MEKEKAMKTKSETAAEPLGRATDEPDLEQLKLREKLRVKNRIHTQIGWLAAAL